MRNRLLSGVTFFAIGVSSALGGTAPAHLTAAQALVAGMVDQNNASNSYTYTLPPVASWGPTFSNASDCSSFFGLLMEHAYHLSATTLETLAGTTKGTGTIKAWPQAGTWYTALVAGTPGTAIARITSVPSLVAGDVMFIKFITDGDSTGDTGHVMMGAAAPVQITAKAPLVTGTTQYTWSVIDCTADPHWVNDTRYQTNADGTNAAGVGQGIVRLYTNSDGTIAGYTWSTGTGSLFKPVAAHAVAFGRPNPSALARLSTTRTPGVPTERTPSAPGER